MTSPMAAVVDGDADSRWLAWKARGAARDRQSSLVMGWVLATAVVVAAGWLVAALR